VQSLSEEQEELSLQSKGKTKTCSVEPAPHSVVYAVPYELDSSTQQSDESEQVVAVVEQFFNDGTEI
jgi:hypothetical protein